MQTNTVQGDFNNLQNKPNYTSRVWNPDSPVRINRFKHPDGSADQVLKTDGSKTFPSKKNVSALSDLVYRIFQKTHLTNLAAN